MRPYIYELPAEGGVYTGDLPSTMNVYLKTLAGDTFAVGTVSYTHLTLPTIYSV